MTQFFPLDRRRSNVPAPAINVVTTGIQIAALILIFCACEPPPLPADFSDRAAASRAASADDTRNDDATDASSTVDSAHTVDSAYTGAWALATDWSVCVTIGARFEMRSRKLLLVNLTRQGDRIMETRQLCQLRLTPILGLKTVVPDAVIAAVGPLRVDSRVLGEGSAEVAYAGGIEAQLMGVKLINPVYDEMPNKDQPSDPRLVDTEGDGKPGASFVIGGGCKLYVAQREVSTLMGRLVAPDRFEGTAVHATEQVVFGSSNAVCGQTFKTFSNSPHHRFVLQRMKLAAWDDDKNGAVDCAELVAHQTEVLTWAQPDDKRCPVAKTP